MFEPDQASPVVVAREVKPSFWQRVLHGFPNKIVLLGLVVALIVASFAAYKLKDADWLTKQEPVVPVSQITASDVGFMPQTLSIKQGGMVVWTNAGTQPHQIAADPFPKNDSIPGLDSTILLQPKDTYSFTFEKKGTYNYHDERNPLKFLGTVIVE